jgi:hypothetical protein
MATTANSDSWEDETFSQPERSSRPFSVHARSDVVESDGLLLSATSTHNDGDTSLPWLLKLLFGLNGLTLSILTLPLMFVINTQVQIPLAYLPTYGAIAFLPYSLKPLYAFTIGTAKQHGIPRPVLFTGLLTFNSLTLFFYTLAPPSGVIFIFVVSFCRGVTDSCAELCLGLTMIDEARRLDSRHCVNGEGENNCNNNPYHKIVSIFQSEAATSRNVGSLVGSLITCFVFLERFLASDSAGGSSQLSGGVVNGLFILTAFLQLLGATTAYFFRDEFDLLTKSYQRYTPSPATGVTGFIMLQQDNNDTENGVDEYHEERVSMDHPLNEIARLQDDERSHPSYPSLEDHIMDETDSFSATDSHSVNSLNGVLRAEQNPAPWACRANTASNCVIIVVLQAVLVVIAMRGPITDSTSHFVWEVMVISLVFAVVMTALVLYCNNWWQSSHRIGLFLILKGGVPSDSMVVSSLFYSLFESQPLLLQMLSLMDMVVASLSSWSYSKLWSRYSSGRPFMILIGGMSVLASLASLLNILMFHAHKENTSSSSNQLYSVLGFAVLAKVFGTFTEEWAFIPEIVLATTSLSVSGQGSREEVNNSNEETLEVSRAVTGIHSESSVVQATPTAFSLLNRGDDNNIQSGDKVGMEYGTLVSCIDFGDQLGSLAAAPLVAILNISRENDFQGLDRLVVICAAANIVVSLAILPLLGKKT